MCPPRLEQSADHHLRYEPLRHAGALDRVLSIEMFEHMKNYQQLMANIARWLRY